MPTMSELKKLTIGTHNKKAGPPRLIVGTVDGAHWATNAHWMVPASRVAVLLDHYNLPTDRDAVYEVNGKLQPTGQEPPAAMTSLLDPTQYTYELTRTTHPELGYLFVRSPNGRMLAIFEPDAPDRERVFFDVEYLDWIDATTSEPIDYSHRWAQDGHTPRLMVVRQSERVLGACGFFAQVQTRRGGCYRDLPDGKRTWEPEEWIDEPAPRLVAVLMPVSHSC